MGLANLVPGISGGTMLLAMGVYPQFIEAVADTSTFRFRARSLLVLACVVGGAAAAIVLLAGAVKGLVLDHRWLMYSLFIGLTLGGVPVIWRLVQPVGRTVIIAAIVGFLAMVGLALAETSSAGTGGSGQEQVLLLVLAGAAGGAAMILPGVSGAYLLLVLGQYVVILGAIESARDAVTDRDWQQLGECLRVFVPVGVGVVIGVVGISNVVKLLLDRFPRATLGFLLGLLLGAVVGLWPFRREAEPGPEGAVSAAEQTIYFAPTVTQVLVALLLIGVGFGTSVGIDRLGRGVKGAPSNGR